MFAKKSMRRATEHFIRAWITHLPMSQWKYTHISSAQTNRCHYRKWSYCIWCLSELLHFTWEITRNHLFCLLPHSFASMEVFLISSVHPKSISHNFVFVRRTFVRHLNTTRPRRHDSLLNVIDFCCVCAHSRKWYTFIDVPFHMLHSVQMYSKIKWLIVTRNKLCASLINSFLVSTMKRNRWNNKWKWKYLCVLSDAFTVSSTHFSYSKTSFRLANIQR